MPKVTHSGFGFTTKNGKNYFPNKESKIMEAGIFHDYRINIYIYIYRRRPKSLLINPEFLENQHVLI